MKKIRALLFILAGVFVFSFAGCSNGGTFTEKSYSSGESEIKSVSIDVTDRELEIGTSEDGQIHVKYFDSEKEYLDISVSENQELLIKLVIDKDWTDYIGTKPSAEYRKIAVEIPDGLLVSFTAKTTNENIKVNPLSFAESVSLDSNGGDVTFERVSVGKSVSLTAKNGNIQGTLIGGWDDFSITCTIKKGDSNLPESKEDGDTTLTADCNNGDINIEFVQ